MITLKLYRGNSHGGILRPAYGNQKREIVLCGKFVEQELGHSPQQVRLKLSLEPRPGYKKVLVRLSTINLFLKNDVCYRVSRTNSMWFGIYPALCRVIIRLFRSNLTWHWRNLYYSLKEE